MNKETYEIHKETLAAGRIVTSGGRTAATLEQLQDLARMEGLTVFGAGSADGEVLAIDSGRLTPALIAEMGEDHPLIVASRRLTGPQLDALVDYFEETFTSAQIDQAPETTVSKPEVPAGDAAAAAAPTAQATQSQMAVGTLDAVTPKTALDNKTNATEPAGKNASKAEGDAAQDAEKAGAKSAA